MKQIAIILLLVLTAIAASAQDKPATKASDKPIETKAAKESPAEATIPAADVKQLQTLAEGAQNAATRLENVQLKLQILQADLKRLTEEYERARDESNAAYNRAAIKAGIPGAEVANYEGKFQPDGSLRLTKKAPPPKQ